MKTSKFKIKKNQDKEVDIWSSSPQKPKKKLSKVIKKADDVDSPKVIKLKKSKLDKRDEKYSRSNNRVDRFLDPEEEIESHRNSEDGENRNSAIKPKISFKPSNDGLIRLNRYIANSGVCSRREADKHITNGDISVNGVVVKEVGTKVSRNDIVKFKDKQLKPEKFVYILLNKPKGYVTTVKDPHEENTVMKLIENACSERVYPVGRLDRNTTGVLLLTNDGDLAKKLMHPKYKNKKIYHVTLDKKVSSDDLQKIATGVELEDGLIAADSVDYADADDRSQIGIEIHSGQNHVVRRIFEHLGYKVKKLDRVYYAGLTKKNVPRGTWRFLNDKEVSILKRNIFV